MTIELHDRSRSSSHRRTILLVGPGLLLTVFGILAIFAGIWYGIKAIIAIGVLILGVAGYLLSMGLMFRKEFFKK